MFALLSAIHVLVAIILILVVLLQSARGTDLAGAFGGMGSQAAFGPRGTATVLSKATVVLAVIFMITSITLAVLANRARGGGEGSIFSGEKTAPKSPPATQSQTSPAPGQPAGPQGIQVHTETIPPPKAPKK